MTVLLLLVLSGVPARGQMFPSAGDSQDTWLILPEKQDDLAEVTILHRAAPDRPYQMRKAAHLRGTIVPHGVAAAGGRLWVVYEDMTVQSFTMGEHPLRPQMRYGVAQIETALPSGVRLRSLAAGNGGPWALVEVQTAKAWRELTAPETKAGPAGDPGEPGEPGVPGVPGGQKESADGTSADVATVDLGGSDSPDLPAAAPSEPELPVDCLVQLQRNRWVIAPLPEAWPRGSRGWLVVVRPTDSMPTLIAATGVDNVQLFRPADGTWEAQTVTLDDISDADVAAVSLHGRLLLSRVRSSPESIDAATWVVGPERTHALPPLKIEKPASSLWSVVVMEQTVALLSLDAARRVVMTRTDITGSQPSAPMAMMLEQPPAFANDPDRLLIVCVLGLSTLLMVSIWRRDPSWNKLSLPESLVLADLPRRIIAGTLDIAPCVVLASIITGTPLDAMHTHWPGLSGSWERLTPGAIAIALVVVHCTLGELFTGSTLGKGLMGLRVATMAGEPPDVVRILLRNLLKVMDLVAWYILPVLAIVGPHHQRLGDLVARTVVVRDRDEPEEPMDDE